MKRIAVYCDGTWNRPDAPYPTNVYKLFSATKRTDRKGVTQLVKYIPGVGTGYGMKGVQAAWDRFRGGVFGAGVTRNIMNAYTFLAEHYEPRDQLYIFGFSRGAFTARSLAGLLRSSGLPPNAKVYLAQRALRRYRDPSPATAPDHIESWKFRRAFSPLLATSEDEARWRLGEGAAAEPALLTVTYLGVWDTVGALGVPGHYRLLARLLNGKNEFHDLKLSRSVMSARHAVSIDERRRFFPPALWENMVTLNELRSGRERPYRQLWFPGDHGSVGGGGDIVGLSNIALGWVAEGAAGQGLEFDADAMAGYAAEENCRDPLHNQTAAPGPVTRAMRRFAVDRSGPGDSWDISAAARDRWNADPPPGAAGWPYRPVPLGRFADEITEARSPRPG